MMNWQVRGHTMLGKLGLAELNLKDSKVGEPTLKQACCGRPQLNVRSKF